MKRIFISLGVFAVFIFSSALYAEIKISKFAGNVMVFQNNKWAPAVSGLSLAAQDVVKTDKSGKVEIVMNETSSIWINENTEVKIGWLGKESSIDLVAGKIRAKLKLSGGDKFTVKTPVSLVGIRGTELIATDKGDLFVLDGIVQFANAAGTANADVPAGQYAAVDQAGAIPPPSNITPEQQTALDQDWSGFEEMKSEGGTPAPADQKEAEKQKLKDEMTVLKQELRNTVSNMKTDVNTTREIVNEIKESDFATGRSMRDVHGNIVRIEQQLMRPNSQTLEFINITKRDSYVYRGKFGYPGSSTSRIDIFDANIQFNKTLPEQLADWPGFISDQKEDSFYPQSMSVKLTNQTDTIEMRGESREKGQPDEKGNILEERKIVADTYISNDNGKTEWKVDPDYDAQDPNKPEYNPMDKSVDESGEKTDDLWATTISPKVQLDKSGEPSRYVKFYVESYAINNDGKILNLKDFTSTSENPFALLKNIGAEGIIGCKYADGADYSTSTNFFKGNIDIIMTPDIVVSIAQKLGSEISNIGDSMRSAKK